MSFEADYRTALLAYAPLGALVGARLGVRMDQEPTFPNIRFQRIATTRLYSMGGRNALCLARVQHDCWSPDNSQALSVMDALIRAIDVVHLAGSASQPNYILNQWLTDEAEPEPVVYRGFVEAKIYFLDSA